MSDISSTKKVGVIGLGKMGQPIAANLAKRFPTSGFDTVDEARARAAAAGVVCCASAAEVLGQSDVVVLSLPNEDVVRAVIEGSVTDGASGCRAIFDTSTTTPRLAEDMARRCAKAGIAFLDAPVTGGVYGAERAELSIMVGGDAAAFESHRDVLDAMGNLVTRIGPSGHGQVAKMVNQMLMAAIYTSANEAFAFAVKHGVDIAKVFRAVEGGGGRSMLLNKIKGPMLAGTLHDDFGLRQHGKDVAYAVRAAKERGIELPVTNAVHGFFQRSCELGLGAIWAGEMWAVWEEICGCEFRATVDWETRAGGDEAAASPPPSPPHVA